MCAHCSASVNFNMKRLIIFDECVVNCLGGEGMSIRKIKAHEAEEDGDYIRIVRRSTWLYWLMFGVVIGLFSGYSIVNSRIINGLDNSTIVAASTLICIFICLLFSNEKEVRRVPKSDLVEIKKYASGHVTVVLDDERVKRQPRDRK